MIYFENVDGRVCIVFPYLGRVLLGSTDIRIDTPGAVRCEDDEVDYVLKSLSYVFPDIAVRHEQIVYRYSGVRPLPKSDESFTGSISRDHFVASIPGTPPVLCLVGGKWTTFRAFGEQTADDALRLLGMARRVATDDRRIGGGHAYPSNVAEHEVLLGSLISQFNVSPARAAHAIDHYGSNASAVLDFCRTQSDAALGSSMYTEAELRFLIRNEFARSHSDLLQRRTSLAITGTISSAIISRASTILTDELGWNSAQTEQNESAFRALLAHDHGLTETILTARDQHIGSL